jgi:hypothetical protein
MTTVGDECVRLGLSRDAMGPVAMRMRARSARCRRVLGAATVAYLTQQELPNLNREDVPK